MGCRHCRELNNKHKTEKRSWTAEDGATISTYSFRLERNPTKWCKQAGFFFFFFFFFCLSCQKKLRTELCLANRLWAHVMKMLSVPLVISLMETWHPVHRKRQILACYCLPLIVLSRDTITITRTFDVVVLASSLSQQLGAKELWTSFGTGKHFRYIAIHDIASKLGPDKCKALPVFNAITGCDIFCHCRKGQAKSMGNLDDFSSRDSIISAACSQQRRNIYLSARHSWAFHCTEVLRYSSYAGVYETRE